MGKEEKVRKMSIQHNEDNDIGIVTPEMIKEKLWFLCFSLWVVGILTFGFIFGFRNKQIDQTLSIIICVVTATLIVSFMPPILTLYRQICRYLEEIQNLAFSSTKYAKTEMDLYKDFMKDSSLSKVDYAYIILLAIFIIFGILLRSVK